MSHTHRASSARPHEHDASQANRAVHRVNIATGATTTLAGDGTGGFSDGVGTSARFTNLYGVAIHPSGAFALVVVRASPVFYHTPASCPLKPAHPPRTRCVGRAPIPTCTLYYTTHRPLCGVVLAPQSSRPTTMHHRTPTASAAWSEAADECRYFVSYEHPDGWRSA